MTKHTQKNDLTGTWNIDTSNDDWILAKSATITTNGTEAIDLDAELTNNDIFINGDISVSGLVVQAINIEADDTAIYIGKTSVIDAAFINVGIRIAAGDVHLENKGSITASLTGILGAAGSSIVNFGTISADNAVASNASDFAFGNAGKLLGDVYGVNAVAGDLIILNADDGILKGGTTAINVTGEGNSIINNSGLIKGPTAISDAEGDAHVVNSGIIKGDVVLGAGEDVFDTRAGTLKGVVHGGEDGDTYIVASQSVQISELADEGNDTVKSTVSYTLGDNLEYLTLIGKGNTNATGNDVANTIYGNAGDNVLKGLAGGDYLASGAGDDIMIGGADDDVFEFNPKNGHDTIKDFEDGTDMIFSNFIQTEEDVQDMLDNHATETNGGVLIEYGKNSMFIKNMDLDHLGADDFILGF